MFINLEPFLSGIKLFSNLEVRPRGNNLSYNKNDEKENIILFREECAEINNYLSTSTFFSSILRQKDDLFSELREQMK